MLCSMLMLAGCTDNQTPQTVYSIGEEYTIETIKFKIENEESQERFILHYDILETQESSTHYFSFILHIDTNLLKNSNEFEYTDNLNSSIEFDENGYYEFSTSRIFYISYKNASEDIKSNIKNKTCNIELPIGTFVFL